MIACLRSTRFQYPDRSRSVFLDLRRMHNHTDICAVKNNKKFTVTKRLTQGFGQAMIVISKGFDTLAEARRYWFEQAGQLEDEGLVKLNFTIAGFHEED